MHESVLPPGSRWRWLRYARNKYVLAAAVPVLLFCGIFIYYIVYYNNLINRKLSSGAYQGSSMVFAAPRAVATGDPIAASDLIEQLQRSGYSESSANRIGWFRRLPEGIEIHNGPDSYFQPYVLTIQFAKGKVARIQSDHEQRPSEECLLEPELISNLFGSERERRRLVQFHELPKQLVQAVTSVEDKHFFEHNGFDLGRILKAAYVDVKSGRKEQGASTLSMQLARNFWLDQQKNWRRKSAEAVITLLIELKLSKQQIFEYYANEVYLGQRGSFAIHGFGQAAQSYFGKDVRDLTLAEAASLAGLIQRPGYLNPFRSPERLRTRRNVVLQLMQENGYITEAEYAAATRAPVTLGATGSSSTEAPYFVDIVNQEVQDTLGDKNLANNSYRIYTTLDSNLQREAANAVRIGMQEVDDQIRRRKISKDGVYPQVALVALDAQTGAVKALIGGRNYGVSQLNHALSLRQPGSIFKPFVYAAAFQNAATRKGKYVTPATILVDEPTTFRFNGQNYQPSNFHEQYRGEVTARTALAKSLNIPTVRVAEIAGYRTVAELAKAAGLNEDIKATPAVALGAYEVSPLEIAGAYTIFTRGGKLVNENLIGMIRNRQGRIVYRQQEEEKVVLDPRAAYLTVDLMQEVMRSGTAAGVRSRGFTLPAAGKTGTSHDGWFAGFTSKLLCIVWVGFDDNRELELEGAKSALPIWTEFMKRAHRYREYREVQQFAAPAGLARAQICEESGQLATPSCPSTRGEVFINGTQPTTECELHEGGFFPFDHQPSASADTDQREKKGVLNRIFGVFK